MVRKNESFNRFHKREWNFHFWPFQFKKWSTATVHSVTTINVSHTKKGIPQKYELLYPGNSIPVENEMKKDDKTFEESVDRKG